MKTTEDRKPLKEEVAIGEQAVPALAQALEERNMRMRLGAVIALSRIGKPAQPAAPALLRILRQGASVRFLMAAALFIGFRFEQRRFAKSSAHSPVNHHRHVARHDGVSLFPLASVCENLAKRRSSFLYYIVA
jgi:hypothetical protein